MKIVDEFKMFACVIQLSTAEKSGTWEQNAANGIGFIFNGTIQIEKNFNGLC